MESYIKRNYMNTIVVDWDIERRTGYKPMTTFYMDFGIAEQYGADAIRETYNSAVKFWFGEIKFATELVMVLNWKIWEHYYADNDKTASLYDELWEDAQRLILKEYCNNDKAMKYYYSVVN